MSERADNLSMMDFDRTASLFPRHHLAIVREPYLSKILSGQKTIESRFSKRGIPPFDSVSAGDTVLLKKPGGPVVAHAFVRGVICLKATRQEQIASLVKRFTSALRLSDDFLASRRDCMFCTLIELTNVTTVHPYSVGKRDRRGWMIIDPHSSIFQTLQVPRPARARENYAKRLHQASRANSIALSPISLQSIESAIALLRSNPWRESWWTKQLDERARVHALTKSVKTLRVAARRRIASSLNTFYNNNGKKQPYRDGYQTPYSGNILFYAQHALALCCRRCLLDWYGIPRDSLLASEEANFFIDLIMSYILTRLPNLEPDNS
jgi:hypothetical protein